MPSSRDDISHLLRRSGFFAAESRVAQLMALDLPQAVEAVLDLSGNPDDTPPPGTTTSSEQSYDQFVTMVQWWTDRMITTPTPIVEKMTLFWHGHFTSSWQKVGDSPAMVAQNRLYRSLALGDFRTLCQRMAVEPAMLVYLDNQNNVAGEPNQNFARELMELFVLGVGNYTEEDVDAAARAWTGHNTVRWDDLRYVFKADRHDFGNKTFFGTTRNWDGPEIINELLDNAAKRPVMARFIARKLWEFFAYQNPEPAVTDALAQIFIASNLSILALLRTLFNRPEFYSAKAKQGLVRSPAEWVVAVLFAVGKRSAQLHPEWYLEGMGQELFNPPNVSGWRPNAYWVNSSAFSGRAEFARQLMWRLYEDGFWADTRNLPVEVAIDRAALTFGISPLSGPTRSALVGWLTDQRLQPHEGWVEAPYLLLMTLLAPELHLA